MEISYEEAKQLPTYRFRAYLFMGYIPLSYVGRIWEEAMQKALTNQ